MSHIPFQQRVSLNWLDGALNASSFLSVPTGKRLEIRCISGRALMPAGVKLIWIWLTAFVEPSDAVCETGSVFAIPHFTGSSDAQGDVPDVYLFTEQVVLFAQGPGPGVEILAGRTPSTTPTPSGEVDITVTGFVVDCA